jgi:hypothetical protein
LNRATVISIERKEGESPPGFLKRVTSQLDNEFTKGPDGTTPFLRKAAESIGNGKGKQIVRYFFGDGYSFLNIGIPDGGDTAIKSLSKLIIERQDPKGNPITCISCTNQDEDVEWMKELEEIAPYVAEYYIIYKRFDDYQDEKAEVQKDQGLGLPYTRGFYLIAQLVAAMNPDDLDAMDEVISYANIRLFLSPNFPLTICSDSFIVNRNTNITLMVS